MCVKPQLRRSAPRPVRGSQAGVRSQRGEGLRSGVGLISRPVQMPRHIPPLRETQHFVSATADILLLNALHCNPVA